MRTCALVTSALISPSTVTLLSTPPDAVIPSVLADIELSCPPLTVPASSLQAPEALSSASVAPALLSVPVKSTVPVPLREKPAKLNDEVLNVPPSCSDEFVRLSVPGSLHAPLKFTV